MAVNKRNITSQYGGTYFINVPYMTPRSLFVIILKVIGIIMLKQAFTDGRDLVFHIMRYLSAAYEGYTNIVGFGVFVIIDLLLVYLLLFRPTLVIDRLKLHQGFYEEQFSLNMDKTMVMNIAMIICGLYLIIDNLPELFKYLVRYLNSESYLKPGYAGPNYEVHNMVFCGLKLMLAYVILTNNDYLARYIIKVDKKQE